MALGVFEIEGQECYRCGDKPAFAAARSTPNGVEVIWACGAHNGELEREEAHLDVYSFAPRCQAGGAGHPCGNAAALAPNTLNRV